MPVDDELFADALPTYLTRFVGRRAECAELTAMLDQPGLSTVCGIGGSGKTRLAVEVARGFRSSRGVAQVWATAGAQRPPAPAASSVWWVPLATTTRPADVAGAVGQALGLGGVSVKHLGGVRSVLGADRALLVLDNCEQVASGCRDLLDRILPACPQLSVLATSRIPLGVADERIYPIPPLGLAVGGDPHAADATALFLDRATSAAPAYALTERNAAALADICRVLHGLPLAIELAASWIKVLAPRDLLTSLSQAQAALGSESALVEERHRSIQMVLDSSWQWLGDAERAVVSALGVFVGGFTRAAAEAVAGADLGTLARLCDLALIQRLPDPTGGSRYQVHELVRTYALSHLERPDDARARHLRHFLGLLDDLGIGSSVPKDVTWATPVVHDLANLEAAEAFALELRDAEQAQRLALGLNEFEHLSASSAEHRAGRLEAALALPGQPTSVTARRTRARALYVVGGRLMNTDPAASHTYFRDAARLFRQIDDAAGVAACINDRGNARMLQGDYAGGRRDMLDSLIRCRSSGNAVGAAWCLSSLGGAAVYEGKLSEAVRWLRDAACEFTALNHGLGACDSELLLGLAHQLRGEWIESVGACRRALQLQRAHHLTATWADLVEVVARLCVEQRRWPAAAMFYGAAASWRGEYAQVSWFPLIAQFTLAVRVRTRLDEPAWSEAYDAGCQLSPDRANQLADELLLELRQQLEAGSAGLSSREVEVLRLIAGGLSNGDIAEQLGLSRRTVDAHLRSVYTKLGVTSRTAALRAAGTVVMPPREDGVRG